MRSSLVDAHWRGRAGGVERPEQLPQQGVEPAAIGVVHRLDLLEERGLLERTPDPADRRSTRITLTPEGRELAVEAARAHVAAEAQMLGALNDADRRRLDALLGKLLGSL
ncbi:MAG: winged helix DNA-binding protein, partial [Actinomycetota bacterium]